MTRPEQASRRFVKQLDPNLVEKVLLVVSPLMRISPTGDALPLDGIKGLIATSMNGVDAVSNATSRRDLPVYCVGSATTRTARLAGWSAHNMGRNAGELVNALATHQPVAPLLHVRGQHSRGHVADRLSQSGLVTKETVAYAQRAIPMSATVSEQLEGAAHVIAPVFSPRSAKLLSAACRFGEFHVAAMSPAVAAELADRQDWCIETASSPDAHAMVALVENLIQAALPG